MRAAHRRAHQRPSAAAPAAGDSLPGASRGSRRSQCYEIRLAGELHELGCDLGLLLEEARCGGEVTHEVARLARTQRDVALARVLRDPRRSLRVICKTALLAYAAEDLGELLVRRRLQLDLVLDAAQER